MNAEALNILKELYNGIHKISAYEFIPHETIGHNDK
jgi:hypothetical protein